MSRKRAASDAPMCLRCFKSDHSSDDCTTYGLISCASCFRLNVLTKTCNCKDFKQPDPAQIIRLAGKQNAPRWFLDLNIHERIFAALVNPSIERGRVNGPFAHWLRVVTGDDVASLSPTLTVNIDRHGQILQITCDIIKDQEDFIQIGADFMKFLKYTLTMEGCTINSDKSYIAPNPYETNYVYNIPKDGADLRSFLTTKRFFMKSARTLKDRYGIPQSPTTRVIKVSQSPAKSNSIESDSDY